MDIAFRNSFDTVPYNIQSVKDDVNHVVKLLDQLKLYASHSPATRHNWAMIRETKT